MPRLLRGVVQASTPHELSSGDMLLDPAVREHLEQRINEARQQAATEAHARGLAEGHAAGREEALGEASAMVGTLADQLAAQLDAIAIAKRETIERLESVALEIARAAVGEVDGLRNSVAHRVEAVLERLDTDVPTIFVAAGQEALVAHLRGVEIEVDQNLAVGEARISAEWCDADLRVDAIWEGLRADGTRSADRRSTNRRAEDVDAAVATEQVEVEEDLLVEDVVETPEHDDAQPEAPETHVVDVDESDDQ